MLYLGYDDREYSMIAYFLTQDIAHGYLRQGCCAQRSAALSLTQAFMRDFRNPRNEMNDFPRSRISARS